MVVQNSNTALDSMLEGMTNSELKSLVKKLSWNDGFGCFYRASFEAIVWPIIKDDAEWAIFLDIDNLNALNSKYDSYEPVNALIKDALDVTRDTDIKAGQLNSGDEIIIIMMRDKRKNIPSNPDALVGRLVESFGKHDMSATYAVVPIISPDLLVNLAPAIKKVKDIKFKRGSTR